MAKRKDKERITALEGEVAKLRREVALGPVGERVIGGPNCMCQRHKREAARKRLASEFDEMLPPLPPLRRTRTAR